MFARKFEAKVLLSFTSPKKKPTLDVGHSQQNLTKYLCVSKSPLQGGKNYELGVQKVNGLRHEELDKTMKQTLTRTGGLHTYSDLATG